MECLSGYLPCLFNDSISDHVGLKTYNVKHAQKCKGTFVNVRLPEITRAKKTFPQLYPHMHLLQLALQLSNYHFLIQLLFQILQPL